MNDAVSTADVIKTMMMMMIMMLRSLHRVVTEKFVKRPGLMWFL